MRLKINLAAGILLILFGLTGSGQGGAHQPNYLITANSAGDVRIGMTIAEARRVLADAKLEADPTQTRLPRNENI